MYRHFPGGKDQLIRETVAWEAARVIAGLSAEIAGAADLAEALERLLAAGRRAVAGHEVLAKVLDTEPELLLPFLTTEGRWLLELMAGMLGPFVAAAGAADPHRTADHLARMVLSLVSAPGGHDLADPRAVAALVRSRFLPAVGEGWRGPDV